MMTIKDKYERIGDMLEIKEYSRALLHLKDLKKMIKKKRKLKI